MTRLAALAAAGALLAAGAAWAVAGHAREPARVVARDAEGRRVAALVLPSSRAFSLTYRHSYYHRRAVERFRAAADGSFRLVAISSPSQAVLDYYVAEGRRTRARGWWTLRLARPVRFARLPLAATAVGRRTLAVAGRRAPLFRRDGRAAHLVIAVEGG